MDEGFNCRVKYIWFVVFSVLVHREGKEGRESKGERKEGEK